MKKIFLFQRLKRHFCTDDEFRIYIIGEFFFQRQAQKIPFSRRARASLGENFRKTHDFCNTGGAAEVCFAQNATVLRRSTAACSLERRSRTSLSDRFLLYSLLVLYTCQSQRDRAGISLIRPAARAYVDFNYHVPAHLPADFREGGTSATPKTTRCWKHLVI